MKTTTLFRYYLLCVSVCIGLLQAEGFTAQTHVTTPSGYTKIEQLQIGDTVISFDHNYASTEYPITNITTSIVDYYIKIGIGNEYIYAAPDQKFYLYDYKKWMPASQLQPADLLINIEGQSVHVDSIEIIGKPCAMYLLSIDTSHTFCVSRKNIITHNFAEAVVVPIITCAANFVITNAPAIIDVAKAAFATVTFLGAYFIQKRLEKKQKVIIAQEENLVVSTNFNNNNNWQDPNDDDKYNKEKYPNGTYKDAGYHHPNSNEKKGRSPRNGQKLLNKAFLVEKSENTFIAIEEREFVVFYKTTEREFHGHIRTWNELTQSMKNTLTTNGLVKQSGKIIKEALKKYEQI